MSRAQHQGAAGRLLWSVSPIVDIAHDGWPKKLHTQAIAALQSWRSGDGEKTPERLEREADWCSALKMANSAKVLPCTIGNRRTIKHRFHPDEVPWAYETSYNRFMLASDVSAWLACKEEEPSPLLRLWFDACGVAWPPVSVADISPFPLKDWAALVAYRKANESRGWGRGNQLEILRAELKQRTEGGNATESAARSVLANELGLRSRQSVSRVLDTERKRDNVSAPAVTKVKDGKKVA